MKAKTYTGMYWMQLVLFAVLLTLFKILPAYFDIIPLFFIVYIFAISLNKSLPNKLKDVDE